MSINISIEEGVLNYIEKKNVDCLSVDITMSGGGCCPTFEMAEINLRRPKDLSKYDAYQSNGINIYVEKKAIINSTLVFSLQKNFLTSSIIVSGLSLRKR